ncbi:flotillin family protein [Lacrimispora sp.]|uniref:flotillin family protein n=1 Tax=Lacrimispora sp. TaxID=2719234 RepID=UPI00399416C6
MFEALLPFFPAVLAIVILGILASGYVKAPPDTAYIISGLKKKTKILIGRAGIKIPFLERLDKLNLKLIPLDIITKDPVPTQDCINIFVDAAVNVKIKAEDKSIDLAAQNFLNKTSEEIGAIVSEVLEGNVREIICTMKLRELIGDRKTFVSKVSENVIPDLEKMGIELVSFNVQNFRDENDVINNLGIDNISQIKKDAAIAKANANKEVAIAQSAADREANDARVNAETEIATRNNELEIKKAELKQISDSKKAQADAAYEIQQQEQQKTIQTATVNAQIARTEREAELKSKEVAVMQQTLEAEINKKADADRYSVEQKAAAELARRQKEAEAKKYEQEKEAEAKMAQAEAEKYAMLQEAEGIKAKGEAEAAAIQAKGLAEAEAMEKKAEAYQKYNKVAMAEMMIKVLPEIAGKIAEPLSQIDKITIIGGNGGAGDGISSVAGNVPIVMAKLFESMKEATGVDLSEIMKADTYDAKVTKNLNITGIPEHASASDAAKAVIAVEAANETKEETAESGKTLDEKQQ